MPVLYPDIIIMPLWSSCTIFFPMRRPGEAVHGWAQSPEVPGKRQDHKIEVPPIGVGTEMGKRVGECESKNKLAM